MLTSSDGEVRAGVELPLLRGGYTDERRARIASGEKALAASHAQLELQRLDARRQASYRYYDWLASGEKLRIARILLQLAVDRDRMMGHRVKKGDAARIEQTDNQRSLVQRESAQITAQRSIQKAALELSLFYRDPNGLPVTPAIEQLPVEGMPVPVAEQSLRSEQSAAIAQEILPRHPDQLRLQAQIEQNEIERGLSKNSILPKLDAELTASQDINAGESKKSIFEYKAALKLEFPLLLRSGRGKFDSASAQGAKLGAQLDLARDRIRIAIQDALQAMDAAQNRIKLARQEVELSIQVEEAERIKFRQGDSNILTVNLRENSTADARGRVVDALADYYRARADFEAASAGQFRDR
jgi:outer membrane protein TolC